MKIIIAAVLCIVSIDVTAQKGGMQFFRPYDERGLHIFETTKADTVPFVKTHVKVGGSFEQTFQTLRIRTLRNLSYYPNTREM